MAGRRARSDEPMNDLSVLFSLTGRVAVITGGAGLLGVRHAEAIASVGGIPVIADIDGGRGCEVAKNLATRYRVPASALQVDITSASSVRELTKTVLDRHERIDILVNNAANNPKVEAGASVAWSRF